MSGIEEDTVCLCVMLQTELDIYLRLVLSRRDANHQNRQQDECTNFSHYAFSLFLVLHRTMDYPGPYKTLHNAMLAVQHACFSFSGASSSFAKSWCPIPCRLDILASLHGVTEGVCLLLCFSVGDVRDRDLNDHQGSDHTLSACQAQKRYDAISPLLACAHPLPQKATPIALRQSARSKVMYLKC